MLIDNNYGIIRDTQKQILDNYLSFYADNFLNANSPDSPAYVIAYVNSLFDVQIQQALEILWNTKNSNTASGLGLDILANTVLNLFRKPQTPASAVVSVTVANLVSYVTVNINVTVTGTNKVIPTGWTVTSTTITPSPAYTYYGAPIPMPNSGDYQVTLYTTDLTTNVPIGVMDTPTAISGVTFNTCTNNAVNFTPPLIINPDWKVTSSTISPTPVYTPNQFYQYTAPGTYQILVYSTDINTRVGVGQLNLADPINNVRDPAQNMISSVTNTLANVLGQPVESDAAFSARRKYYLNVDGQTYYGMEKAILNIGAPALRSVFIEEITTDDYADSYLIVKVTITFVATPIVIPVNWAVTLSTIPAPSAPYKTKSAYTFTSSGTYYIPLFSTDGTHEVHIGDVIGAATPIVGVTVVGNLDPAILRPTLQLGQRGYIVYLDYPVKNDGFFDTQDVYLQKIASAAFEFHPLGTQFYQGANAGSTQFTVKLPYSGYDSTLWLSPLNIVQITMVLTLVYNVNPDDSGFSNGLFDVSLLAGGVFKQQLVDITNNYFKSKTLPTDLVYTINELSELIQAAYTGIVAFSNGTTPFTFGEISPLTTGLVFLRRDLGSIFNLNIGNFTFNAVNKESL